MVQTLFLEVPNNASDVQIRKCAVLWLSPRAGLETLLRPFASFCFTLISPLCRVEKKAINSIVNMTIPEQSKNYYEEDISMTVVKIYLNTTNGFVPIAAPSVRLLPHTVNAKSQS